MNGAREASCPRYSVHLFCNEICLNLLSLILISTLSLYRVCRFDFFMPTCSYAPKYGVCLRRILVGTGCLNFRHVRLTLVLILWRNNTRSDFRSTRSNPSIAPPFHLWLSTMYKPIDLATKANAYLRIKEHKCEQGRCTLNIPNNMKHMSWGLPN
jgi:hypothetical protein